MMQGSQLSESTVSWGTSPGRVRVACICSRRALKWAPMGNRDSDGQLRRLDVRSAWPGDSKSREKLTVVAFLSLGAITRHVSESAAGVAGLL